MVGNEENLNSNIICALFPMIHVIPLYLSEGVALNKEFVLKNQIMPMIVRKFQDLLPTKSKVGTDK